ncbi:MFS transporter [Microbacterium sp. 18062]|uniref:MFS transporter n=1 Tax=Microbacterium sp. 18062 TaxID=2681410 RepID=UPI0013574BBE|nr:MFS transporter [Microbacterium sp. 18062]
MSRFQILTVIVCVAATVVDGFDLIMVTFLAPQISAEFALSASLLGVVLAAATGGMVIGAAALTPLADRTGRRPIILASLALGAVGMLVSALSPDVAGLVCGRVITGIGIGGVIGSVGVLLNEYSSRRRYGLIMGIFASGIGLGGTLAGGLTAPVVAAFGWRGGLVAGAIVTALALVVAAVALAESLEYLAAHPSERSLHRTNQILRRMGHEPLTELPPVAKRTAAPIRGVFVGRAGRLTVLAMVGFGTLQISFYFVTFWMPQVVSLLGAPGLAVAVSMGMGLGAVVGSLAFGILSTWISRGALTAVMIALGALALAGMAFVTAAPNALVVLAITTTLMGSAGIAGYYAIVPNIYSARMRGTGFGAVLAVGRLAAFTSPIIGGWLIDARLGFVGVFVAFSAPLLIAAVVTVVIASMGRRRESEDTPSATPTLESA